MSSGSLPRLSASRLKTGLSDASLRAEKIYRLILVIILIVCFEGVARKWLSPVGSNALVALRDLLALYVGVFALLYRPNPTSGWHIVVAKEIAVWWTVIVVFWGLVQLMFNQSSPLTMLFGVRFWIVYAWFALSAAMFLEDSHVRRLKTFLVIVFVLTFPLALAQYVLPVGHILNTGVGGDEDSVFLVVAGVVRASSTFSFVLGYTCFLACVLPILLDDDHGMLGARMVKLRPLLLMIFIAATFFSGARGAVVHASAMFIIYIAAHLFFGSWGKGFWVLLMVLVIGLIFSLSATFSPESLAVRAIDNIVERFLNASELESFSNRVTAIFFGESEFRAHWTVFGAGLGAGANVSTVVATGENFFSLAETEPGRVLLEGGLLGVLYQMTKICILVAGLVISIVYLVHLRRVGPIIYWSTFAVAILTWPVTGQISANAFGFIALFFALRSFGLANSDEWEGGPVLDRSDRIVAEQWRER